MGEPGKLDEDGGVVGICIVPYDSLRRVCGNCGKGIAVVQLWHVTGQSSVLCKPCACAFADDIKTKAGRDDG